MDHPRDGERVFVRPSCPGVRVQRGEGLFGQFLPDAGMECLWDQYLHQRLREGAISWSPLTPAAPETGGV
jgi:hypothetical protein